MLAITLGCLDSMQVLHLASDDVREYLQIESQYALEFLESYRHQELMHMLAIVGLLLLQSFHSLVQQERFFLRLERLGNPCHQWFRVGKLLVWQGLEQVADLSHGQHLMRYLRPRFPKPVLLLLVLEVPRMQELFHPILGVLHAHHQGQRQGAGFCLLVHPFFCPS